MRLDQLRAERRRLNWARLCMALDTRASQVLVAIPIVGYILIFNDQISSFFEFDRITNGGTLIFSTLERLRLLYFGLIILGGATLWLRLRCPTEILENPSKSDFVREKLSELSVYEIARIYNDLEVRFSYGLFDDVPFDKKSLDVFIIFASDRAITPSSGGPISMEQLWSNLSKIRNTEEAKVKCDEFLKHLLEAKHDYENYSSRREVFVLALFGAFSGFLILLPSIDVFF